MRYCLATVAALALLTFAACGGDGQPSGSITPTAKETVPPTRSPGPTSKPRLLSGINFYDLETWSFENKSGCASQNPEGPFLGPSQFSVSAADVPEFVIADGRLLNGVRMCKLAGVTVLNYLLDPGMHLELIAGPPEWPTYAQLDTLRLEGELVIAPVAEQFPGIGANVIRATPFGLIVGYGSSEEDLITVVSAIDAAAIVMPEAKDIFTGEVNGIHFESEFSDASKQCKFSAYGFIGAEPTTAPGDPRVAIEPSYLPVGATILQSAIHQKCGDIESAEVAYSVGDANYLIVRKSGVSEWGSVSSEDWYSPTTVAGLDAVLLAPPEAIASEVEPGATLFIREEFGLTVVDGPDVDEITRIAEGLNR